jgi:hypothetical protein
MEKDIVQRPRPVQQVTISSTFTDLKAHRTALIDALHKHKLHANVMEHDDACFEPAGNGMIPVSS